MEDFVEKFPMEVFQCVLQDVVAVRALSTLRGLRGAPEAPPLCRETQFLGQHMLERWEKMG